MSRDLKNKIVIFVKMTVGSIVSILISLYFGLSYAITAGVVSILSLEQTKKKSFEVAYKRLIISFFGLLVSSLLYSICSFGWISLFLSISLIVIFGLLFSLKEGIVVSVVLISHSFVDKDLSYQTNALFILLVGVLVALVLNLFMPSNEKEIQKEINDIDGMVRTILDDLIYYRPLDFSEIENRIKIALSELRTEQDNSIFSKRDYRTSYIQMRLSQVEHLKSIEKLRLGASRREEPIDDFLIRVKNNIGLENKATSLLEELHQLELFYKKTDLPKTREEFEQRAYLYLVLIELKSFLNQKIVFHQTFHIV